MARSNSKSLSSASQLAGSRRTLISASLFAVLSASGLWFMRIAPARNGTYDILDETAATRKLPNGVPLKPTYTGIEAVDGLLSLIVAVFLYGTRGWDKINQLQQIYFLINILPMLAIWNVEAFRRRNAKTLVGFPAFWAPFIQLVGGATFIPLHDLCYAIVSSRPGYYAAGGEVSLSHAKALLPALILGYLIPTIAMYLPWKDINTTMNMTSFWQASPLYPNLLMLVLPSLVGGTGTAARKSDTSVRYLRRLYLVTGGISATVHLGTLFMCFNSSGPQVSLRDIFVPDGDVARSSLAAAMNYMFQVDFIVCLSSSITWAVLVLIDLKGAGKMGGSLVGMVVAIATATLAVGPGAAMAMVWYWVEGTM